MEDDSNLLEGSDIPDRRNITKLRITVEPVGFLFFTASIIQSIVIQNLYLDKVCVVNFHLNKTDCSSHNKTSVLDIDPADEVQRYVSDLNIYASLIENIPNVVFVLFLGPWSDKNGRKVPMIAPLIGHLLSVGLYMTNFYFPSWPAEYILLASVPLGLCGGTATLLMALNSYIADITTSESRTSRLSMLYGSLMISFPAANFASIYIYTYGGYLAVFGTSFGLGLLTLLYIIFFITDSRGQGARHHVNINTSTEELEEPSPPANCSSVVSNLWECFYVTFQPRNDYKRACIIVLLMSMCFYVFAIPGSVAYLYARKLFGWDQPQFALFSTISSLAAVAGSLFLLPLLSSCLKVNDCVIGIIALVGNITGSLVIAFAKSPLVFYLASFGFILTGSIGVVIRSVLSKLVLSDELSHVYSVLASFESIVPLASSPTYNLVYKATLDVFPGCVYALSSCTFFFILIFLSTVLFLQWKGKHAPLLYNPVNVTSTLQADC